MTILYPSALVGSKEGRKEGRTKERQAGKGETDTSNTVPRRVPRSLFCADTPDLLCSTELSDTIVLGEGGKVNFFFKYYYLIVIMVQTVFFRGVEKGKKPNTKIKRPNLNWREFLGEHNAREGGTLGGDPMNTTRRFVPRRYLAMTRVVIRALGVCLRRSEKFEGEKPHCFLRAVLSVKFRKQIFNTISS